MAALAPRSSQGAACQTRLPPRRSSCCSRSAARSVAAPALSPCSAVGVEATEPRASAEPLSALGGPSTARGAPGDWLTYSSPSGYPRLDLLVGCWRASRFGSTMRTRAALPAPSADLAPFLASRLLPAGIFEGCMEGEAEGVLALVAALSFALPSAAAGASCRSPSLFGCHPDIPPLKLSPPPPPRAGFQRTRAQ